MSVLFQWQYDTPAVRRRGAQVLDQGERGREAARRRSRIAHRRRSAGKWVGYRHGSSFVRTAA